MELYYTMLKEITIQFTEECNASCPYCFAPYKRNAILSSDNFKEFLNFCKKDKPDIIHITGGEPTIHNMFQEYVSQLSTLSSLVIYSNFATKGIVKNIKTSNPKEIVFLVNITSYHFLTFEEKAIVKNNIIDALNLNFRVAFSFTYHELVESMEDSINSIITYMRQYKIRNLRLSQSLSSNGTISTHELDKIRSLYSFVAKNIDDWTLLGLRVYFDCPVPPCFINGKDFKKLRQSKAVSVHCIPKAFVMSDLTVTHCYFTMGMGNGRKLHYFSNIDEIKKYSKEMLNDMFVASNRTGCRHCSYSSDAQICGCPSYDVINGRGEND